MALKIDQHLGSKEFKSIKRGKHQCSNKKIPQQFKKTVSPGPSAMQPLPELASFCHQQFKPSWQQMFYHNLLTAAIS